MLKRKLTDRYRLLRALLVGTVVSVLFSPVLATKEVITISITFSLLLDFLILIKQSWLIGINETREIFQQFNAKESSVAERTIALVFLSVGILSFCIAELHSNNDVLPNKLHVFYKLHCSVFNLASAAQWICSLLRKKVL